MLQPYVYALVDPRTDAIRYVGKSHQRDKSRLREHIKSPTNAYTEEWIGELLAAGRTPIMRILEDCDTNTVFEREAFWIRHLLERGCKLLNVQSGGSEMIGHRGANLLPFKRRQPKTPSYRKPPVSLVDKTNVTPCPVCGCDKTATAKACLECWNKFRQSKVNPSNTALLKDKTCPICCRAFATSAPNKIYCGEDCSYEASMRKGLRNFDRIIVRKMMKPHLPFIGKKAAELTRHPPLMMAA